MSVGASYLPGFGMAGPGEKAFFPAFDAQSADEPLGNSRSPVVDRGIGYVHAGKLADEGLKLKDGLERSLADLRLVGGVGGVELRPPENMVHHGRDIMVVGSRTQKRDYSLARGSSFTERTEMMDKLHLRQGPGKVQGFSQAKGFR